MKNLALISGKLSVIILFLLYSSLIYSQAPRWKWAQTAGDADVFQSVTDTLGNTVVLGKFYSNNIIFGNTQVPGSTFGGSHNLYLVKYNSVGRVQWAVSVHGADSGTTIIPKKLLINKRSEIVIYGTVQNTSELTIRNTTLSLSNTNENIFIAKFFKTGRLLWARVVNTIGGVLPISIGTDALIDNAGNVYATGYFSADSILFGPYPLVGRTDTLSAQLFLVKYDLHGLVEWAKTNAYENIGSGNTYGTFLANDKNENIYLAGVYNGNESFILGTDTLMIRTGENLILAKYDASGNFAWAQGYGGNFDELPDNLMTGPDNNIYLVGVYNSPVLDFYGQIATNSGINFDVFISKIDPNGIPLWVQSINTQIDTIKEEPGTNIKTNIDEANNLCFVAEFMGTSVLFNDNEQINDKENSRDIIIAKLNGLTGEVEWAQSGNSPGDNMFNSVVFDKAGSIYLSGNVFGNPLIYEDVDATMVAVKDTIGNGGFYIIKIDNTGKIGYARSVVNAMDNFIADNSISVDPFGNLFVVGKFAGFGTNLGNVPVTNTGNLGIYLAKFSYVTDISGMVVDDEGTPVNEGYVKLYGFTRFQRSPLSDSVLINADGSYMLENIPFGWYIIFAKPGNNTYPDAVQTYYPSAAHWDEAEPILVTSTDPITDRDIIINDLQRSAGDAKLGGEVYEADTTSVFKSGAKIYKKAAKEVYIILVGGTLKSEYQIIAFTQTDEYGGFEFENIDNGDYGIIADIPGLPHDELYYVTVTGGQFISNLDYMVGEEKIYKGEGGYTVIPGNTDKLAENLIVSPNPNNGSFTINLENIDYDAPVSFEIVNTAGELIYKGIITNPADVNYIDLSTIAKGAYILKVTVNDERYLKKLIVK